MLNGCAFTDRQASREYMFEGKHYFDKYEVFKMKKFKDKAISSFKESLTYDDSKEAKEYIQELEERMKN